MTDTLIKTKLFASVLCKWNVVASQEHCHPKDGLLLFDGQSLYPIYSYNLRKGLYTELLIIEWYQKITKSRTALEINGRGEVLLKSY